jgi:FAD/FMN-containing dehydrogenase
MKPMLDELKTILKGEVLTDKSVLNKYSHDASIYELAPSAVLSPMDSKDIENLVSFINAHRHIYPSLSITPRGAGTDMSGGAISDSLLINMADHFTKIHSASSNLLHTQAGASIRDINPLLASYSAMLGCAPTSHAFCTIGGVVANNSAGEQSLRYGNADKSIREVSVVLADGKEHTFGPINKRELQVKMAQKNFEGALYRRIYSAVEENYDLIKNARPKTNKNSMGYNLWTVWDRDTGIFDMSQLFTGSQGTLGVITDIKIAAVPKAKHSGLLLIYLTSLKQLSNIIPIVTSHAPATFEGLDDITFNLGIKYFKTLKKQLGVKEWTKQQIWLLSTVAKFKSHLPNMLLMVEFDSNTPKETYDKIVGLQEDLAKYHFSVQTEIEGNEAASAPFWNIRRAALSFLRNQSHGKYAAPFIDDMTVLPKYTAEFLQKVRKIIRKYKLPATIQGHFGDGNFHIIPLLDVNQAKERAKLEPAMRELVPIILKYGGTMAGEHNDGMVRGPWLPAVFGNEMYELFKYVKETFDPQYIFNPNKKTDASWDFSMSHIRTSHR